MVYSFEEFLKNQNCGIFDFPKIRYCGTYVVGIIPPHKTTTFLTSPNPNKMDYEMLLIYFLGIALGCYDYSKDFKIMRIDFRGQELMFIARDFFRRKANSTDHFVLVQLSICSFVIPRFQSFRNSCTIC